MMDLTIATWGPPAAVLAIGAVAGLALSLSQHTPWDYDPRIADLHAEREQLMRQIRDMEADRGKLGEAEYARRRAELVEQTAEVLRQLDQGVKETRKKQPSVERRATWPAYLAATLVFMVAAGIALQQGVKERQEMAPMAASAPQVDPVVAQAETALEADPTDQDALCTVRKFALFTRDLDTAMALMERSREAAPEAPCTITHMAALYVFIGRLDQAKADLDALGDRAPNEAKIWQAIIHMQLEQTEPAKTLLREAVMGAQDSLERDFASYLLSSLMMPPGQSPSQGQAQGGAPAAGGPALTGTITGELEGTGTLYIYIRGSETERGPPLAALQIKDWSLPMEFDLAQATVIRAVPEQFYVSAKLSRSGDPMVTGPEDAVAKAVGPVGAGDGLELVLE